MITGNQNPIVGKDEYYTFTDFTQMFETPDVQYVWAIWKKMKTGKWVNITQKPPKYTKRASFKFGEKVIGEEFRLEIYKAKKKMLSKEWEAKKMSEIFVIPTSSKSPKITKVVLFNRGAKDVNKASYRDTLIAKAHCVAMFNQEVEFNLWEDDAAGGGHNAEINKNNKAPRTYKARVNEDGIAEAKISLSADERILKQIANRYMMRGDTDEGANHEYYVTATYSGKIQKASQVNVSVANPDNKSKPKADTPKFPAGNTGNGAVRQADPEGNIHDAYFVNKQGQQLSKVSVGEHVKIRILSRNMIGKRIQYVVWEYDATSNDEVYRSGVIKIVADSCDTGGFVISESIFNKGIDFGSIDADAKKQNYFIEIISFDTSNTSKKFGVTEEGLMTVEKAKSPAMVKNSKPQNTPSTCLCKEQYKDLIWGEKVSCEFRKKAVEISRRAGVDPNNFMAAMAHETGGTFDPTCGTFKSHKDESKEGYVGLLQIGKDAAKDICITRTELLEMSHMEQLDYMEKYLNLKWIKGKLNTLTDFYLAVLFPVDCGKGNQPNHIVFDNSLPITYKNGKVIKNLNYWRNKGYKANPAFHKEKNEKGKTYVWEIAENIKKWYDNGLKHKVKDFSCQNVSTIKPTLPKNSKWHEPVDNPICTLHMQNVKGGIGTVGEHWGLFGRTRNGHVHQGLDLFATPGKDVYACAEAIVYKRTWHSGYGNTLTLKITDKQAFYDHRREYSLLYPSQGEIIQGQGFDKSQDIFLFYAHLEEILVDEGNKVDAGKVIAKTGVSGVKGGTRAPHLHFEIFTTKYAVGLGLSFRCNPGYYVHFKSPKEQSNQEKELQAEAFKTKINDFYGKEK